MLQQFIDDVRIATGMAARQTFFIAAVAGSLFITTAFLCAAAFVFVLERYGLFQACLTEAGIFFVVTILSAGSYFALKRSATSRAVRETKSVVQSFAPNPMMLAAGLQIARAVGFRKLLPILAIGGLALGIIASRSQNLEAAIKPDDEA